MLRRFVHAFAFAAIITAAACSDLPNAPTDDDPTRPGTPCSAPAPEPGMVCRGDIWSWN